MNKSQDKVSVNRTKLYRPPLTTDYVSRDALEASLEESVALPLTVVSAPAGYGKSTLISHWLNTSDFPGAWLSLDESDTDIRVFLTFFVTALRTIVADACKDTLRSINAESLPPLPIMAAQLCNDLDELDRRVILVLDDYHRIGESDIHLLIDRLLERPLQKLHLVILARSDPSLSLASLRGYHLLKEIRMYDLKFSSEDTLAFLEKTIEQPLQTSTLKKLQESTEGWPVGIRLTALALQHRDDIEGYLDQFDTGIHSMQEFLVREVISGQTRQVRDCLLSTSILGRFNAPLCEAMWENTTGGKAHSLSGKEFIEILENSGLFCIALDDSGDWYRFHHLFGDLLQYQLEEIHGRKEISVLHNRASIWFAKNGYIEDALQHSLAGNDIETASRIVGTARHELMNRDQWHRLDRWLKLFSHQTVQQNTHLLLLRLWLSLHHWYQIDNVIKDLETMDGILDSAMQEVQEKVEQIAEMAAIRTNISYWILKPSLAVELAGQVLRDTPENHECIRSTALMGKVASYQMLGNIHEGEKILWDYMENKGFSNASSQARLLQSLCIAYWPEAESQKLEQSANRLLEISLENGLSWNQSYARYYLGLFHYDRNDLDAAAQQFDIVARDPYLYPMQNVVHCSLLLSLTYLEQGFADRANELADSISKFCFERGNRMFINLTDAFVVDLALRQGRSTQAARWIQNFEAPAPHAMQRFFNAELTLAREMLTRETPQERRTAAEYLDSLQELLSRTHNRRLLIDVLGMKALLSDSEGDVDTAVALLTEAIILGQPGRLIRPLADLGPGLVKLLYRLDLDPEGVQYVSNILAVMKESHQAIDIDPGNQPLAEALSPRELEILHLFARNLSNIEIAEQLFISPGTVKRHAHNIMGKLAVSNRREAVSKATGLGILKSP